MRRLALCSVVLGIGLCQPAITQAGDFWDRFHLDFLRMNYWPEPFVHADRELVRSPLVAMTSNGWRLQTTLSDHFFEGESQTLTRAGQLKLRWILTQAPAHRRTVFVLRSMDPHQTELRLAAVRSYVQSSSQPGTASPDVLVSDTAPAGGAGDYFDQVDRQLKASVPPPRLPARGGVNETGG